MAERTVNVNINYNVKTVEIEKLAQASMRAQQATDRLQQSSQKFSQQSTTGNRATSQSIEAMRVQMQRLKTQIDVTNQSDTKRLASLTTQYKGLKKQIDDFNRSLNQTGKEARETQSRFGGLLNAVKLVFTAAVARQVVDMSLGMAELAGNVDGVERAFKRAFPNAEILLDDLRRATQGTITDFQLMQQTIRASNLGVDINEFATLLQFAQIRAQQTGESVDYFVDSIVTGIGRRTPRVLDNLQISIQRIRNEMGGLSFEAATAKDVTQAMARIAREEIQKMGGQITNSATTVKSLRAEFEELRIAIGKATTEGTEGFAGFLKDAVVALKEFAKARFSFVELDKNLLQNEIKRQALQAVGFVRQKADTDEFNKDQVKKIDFIQQEINSRVQLIGKYNDEIKKLREISDFGRGFGFPGFSKENQEGAKRFAELTEEFGIRAKAVFEQEIEQARTSLKARVNNKAVIEETIRLLSVYLESVQRINEVEEVQLGLIEEVEKRIKELNEQIQSSRSRQEIARLNREVFILQGRLSDLKKLGLPEFKSPETFEKIAKTFEEKIKKNAEETTQEFLKMEDVISRIDASLRNLPRDPIPIPEIPFQPDFLFQLGESIIENQEQLIQESIDITTGYLNDIAFAEVEAYNFRIDNLRSFFDEQILLAGDNERAKQELRVKEQRQIDALRRQQAQKEKQARRFSVIVDTAASISKTAAQLGFPAALPFIALAIAQGALQLSAINRAQPRGFRKGKIAIDGPGTTTSDSIPARISRGESVISAEATRNSMQLLEAVNAKKIDDRILKDIRQTSQPGVKIVQMDHRPIVEAIEKQKYPDLVRDGNIVWEAKRIGNYYKRYVRSKAMSK